jgi:hypothetical protein
MSQLFQPAPPPCVKCGIATVVAPAFEEGQRAFLVRCPACGRAGTYSLDYSTPVVSPIMGPLQLAASSFRLLAQRFARRKNNSN